MALQFGTTYRNAVLDQFETTVGASARLYMFTGSPPATCATADSGTQLLNALLPADWMAAASSGVKALSGTWASTALATGTAGHFRIKDNAGSITHMQGTITSTAVGTGDMLLTNTSVSSGVEVTVSAFNLSISGG